MNRRINQGGFRVPNRKLIFFLIVLAVVPLGVKAQTGASKEHWVATWAAPIWLAPVTPPAPPGRGGPPANAVPSPASNPAATPAPGAQAQSPAGGAASPAAPNSSSVANNGRGPAPGVPQAGRPTYRPVGPILNSVSNQTIRMIGRLSMGGSSFRIRLTNSFGAQPVTITAVHAALRVKDAAIDPASDRPVTFDGKTSVTIGPGMEIASDPFALSAANFAHFAVTVYVQGEVASPAHTALASHVITYVAAVPGDFTAAKDLEGATLSAGYYWLSGIDVVAADKNAGTVVALGDSITDATGSPFEDQDWPSLLASRLSQDKRTQHLSVANVGISGNRVLADGLGTSGLSRFEKDVLAQPNVRWLVLLEGINDIGGGSADADHLIGAYKQIIAKAHEHQIGVVACTILPFRGAFYYSDEKDKVRQAVNNWMRTSGAFDAVVDFEAAVKDPSDPLKIREDMHRGDNLHPNPAGYEAMAKAFDISVFAKSPKM